MSSQGGRPLDCGDRLQISIVYLKTEWVKKEAHFCLICLETVFEEAIEVVSLDRYSGHCGKYVWSLSVLFHSILVAYFVEYYFSHILNVSVILLQTCLIHSLWNYVLEFCSSIC